MDDPEKLGVKVVMSREKVHQRTTSTKVKEAKSQRWERLPWPGLHRCGRSYQALFILFSILIRPTLEASFYGSSFVSLPLQDAKSSTDISFKFRTSRPESLLFLVAGKTDYCLIMLQQGIVKVHINLGAGESEVSSPHNLKLNDLEWHHVKLIRNEADIQLILDNEHTSRASLPGRFYELNIHYGVFVGGMGDFNEIFLGNQKNFRGCLENVYFNSIDVMIRAEEESSQGKEAKVYNVQWECSKEFDLPATEPISYVSDDSFISFPSWISRSGAVLAFTIKTVAANAVLAYNAGHANSNDFVAIEIRRGKVRLLLDQGNGVSELRHDALVNDGDWHKITAVFRPDRLEISVDGTNKYSAPNRGTNKHIDLTDRLFIGGIQLKKKTRAIRQGVKSGSSALQGCLKDIELDGRIIGLPEVLETYDIRPGCVWDYPCVTQPCQDGEVCSQDGLSGYQCSCETPPCGDPSSTIIPTLSAPGDFVLLKSLQVEEGSQAVITTDNIKVLPDFKKLGVPKTGVLFHIIEFPKHGELSFGQNFKKKKVFSLDHLTSNKIQYIHNGKENVVDSFVFEMEIKGPPGYVLPHYLTVRQRFLFEIRILPVNDKPTISGTLGSILMMAAGSKMLLPQQFLQVSDQDTKMDQIVIIMSYNDSRAGYLEHSKRPGERVTSFKLGELLNNNMAYVHRGPLNTIIGFQAWDGEDYSSVYEIKVQAFELSLMVVNNTGLVVSPGGTGIITSHNLTFTTNSPEQDFDIKLEITNGPNYGKIQRHRSNGKWVTTKRFSQRQIEKEKIRYVHSRGNPRVDFITFIAQVNGQNVGKSFTFSIKFIRVNINVINNEGLKLENIGESVITEGVLMYQTYPQESDHSKLIYTLISPPKQGNLFITQPEDKGSKLKKLYTNSNFSQVEILSGRLKYKLIGKVYSIIHDKFSFTVSTPKQTSEPQTFNIYYSPGDTSVDITLESCEVEEGGRKIITNKYLDIRTLDFGSFVYNISQPPIHGWLSVLSPNKVDIIRPQTDYFTSLELSDHRLFYTHDDSESRRDSFAFVATKRGGGDFQYKATFHIHVILRNDQTPNRAVDKVFHVVEGGEKILTEKDLLFVDMDIDTKPEDIKFESRATPNGELVYAEDPTKRVSEFTQQDINDKKILFKHKGSNFGRILIWVNDGQLWVSTELKVRASAPFVKVENNTGLIVQRGDSGTISSSNLSSVTNMNTMDSGIIYSIKDGPFFGKIYLEDDPVEKFTSDDILSERVEYRNNDNSSLKDYFRFEIIVDDVKVESEFKLNVYPESYWDGLEIGSNNSLLVEEGTSVRITHYDLKVIHGQMAPEDIQYIIQSEPKHGFLEIDPPPFLPMDSPLPIVPLTVNTFTQAVIDEGRLHYVQSMSNQTSDSFIFDVTNGISSIYGLVFHFIIIPKDLYIETRPVGVIEGQDATLSMENIHVLTSFYEDKIADFLVVSHPQHGSFISAHNPNKNVTIFTLAQLKGRQIKYLHDGSDSTEDSLLLVARTAGVEWPDKDKTSISTTLKFIITPVNDAIPQLINNTGLTLWAGSTVTIKSENLGARDQDTPDTNITFSISSPHCGMVSLDSRPAYPISKFTQHQIASDQVLFTHSGCLSGGFSIQLSDGLNSVKKQQFDIQIKQLALRETVNKELSVFPGMESLITQKHLVVETTDLESLRQVVFLITNGPTKGRLLYLNDDGRYEEVQNFTQANVNTSRIFYRHEKPFTQLRDYDFFNFEAMADYAPYRLKSVFNIIISVTSMIPGGIDRYTSINQVTCQEGGNVTIYPQNLNTSGIIDFIQSGRSVSFSPGIPQLRLKFTSTPLRGKLTLGSKIISEGSVFTQRDVDMGLLKYSHDHSDSLSDRIGLAVYLAGDSFGSAGKDVLVYEGQLNVSITPVNDRMPHLVTKNPSMVVVRGQSKTINTDMLEVRDPDTSPENIIYTILDNSLQGKIVFRDRTSHGVTHFTQKDINDDRVIYLHDGSSAQTQFYFSVTDGRFQPRETGLSRHFRIHVIPLTLVLENHTSIRVDQGTTTAFITKHNMGAATNGRRDNIQYSITIPPKGGQLLVEDRPAEVFWQINIDRDEVIYMQTDMTLSNDSFTADISNQDNKIPGLMFNITVKPLVKQDIPFVATIDNSTPLTTKHLDATKLAGLTNSNPIYYLLTSPKLGKIKRIIRTSRTREPRSIRDREVWHFTHEDLKNGVIYFVGSNIALKQNTTDGIQYRLEAPGVQPALGVFEFIVTHSGVTPWQPLPNVTPTGLVPLNNIGGRKDIVIAISVIASVLLIIITAILLVKCRMGKEESQNKRSNGHICQLNDGRHRKNSQFDDIYDSCARSGVMSLHSEQPISSPRLTSERYTGNGTLPRHGLGLSSHGANISDSDSWMESSRSRETSPSSSIPPSLPAFRVIPLCESESSGTHLSDPPLHSSIQPPFSRNSRDFQPHPPPSDANPADQVLGDRLASHGQPLLRRNQYWV